ncbi:MAG: cob(I)yrinic acid a,c-diamide adenosyltransferase [Deltaproteobacteria bacterium]|nr:cob(I)yrinic acid a,c-diamide adenosyltransferase [Deltaproteobacteria bacterium]
MKIYTKTGDSGETSLFSGKRVPKDSPYIEAYGTIDELSSCLGLAISFLKDSDLKKILTQIQHTLFEVGTDLATAFDDPQAKAATFIKRLKDEETTQLEKWIDTYDPTLPALKNFILPSGTSAAVALHIGRTVCRRAERLVTTLIREKKANPKVLLYLNRLSDLLFVLARAVNHLAKEPETIWERSKNK